MRVDDVFADLPIPYRYHFFFALEYLSFCEARYNGRGHLTAYEGDLPIGERFNLLRREHSLKAAFEALIIADVLSGSSVGGDRLKDLAHDVRVEGLERRREFLFPEHNFFLGMVRASAEFVAQRISAQLDRKE